MENYASAPEVEEFLQKGVRIIKNGHSSVFDPLPLELPELERCDSRRLLRPSSLPAIVPDVSKQMVNEGVARRKALMYFYEKDSTAFRRRQYDEGASKWFLEKQQLRHYLGSMHPYRDPADINKDHKFSQSRIPLDISTFENQTQRHGPYKRYDLSPGRPSNSGRNEESRHSLLDASGRPTTSLARRFEWQNNRQNMKKLSQSVKILEAERNHKFKISQQTADEFDSGIQWFETKHYEKLRPRPNSKDDDSVEE